MITKNILCVIPARGGSKGIPYKNIKKLGDKPLIGYTIDIAKQIFRDEDICVTTDDEQIIKVVENYGLKVPFIRPEYLATDTATTNDVLLHAIDFFEKQGKFYDIIVLLQPTSPFRTINQLKEALSLYQDGIDMIISVKESHAASVICQENQSGFLELCFNQQGKRRQDLASFYECNGAIYIINKQKLIEKTLPKLEKKVKYVMDEISSIDIDTPLDWELCEHLLKKNSLK